MNATEAATGILTHKAWLEQDFWAAETLRSNGDDVAIRQFVNLLLVTVCDVLTDARPKDRNTSYQKRLLGSAVHVLIFRDIQPVGCQHNASHMGHVSQRARGRASSPTKTKLQEIELLIA